MNGYSDFAKKVILEIETKRARAAEEELLKAHIQQAYPGCEVDLTKFDFGPKRYAPKGKVEILCLFFLGDTYHQTGIWQIFSIFQSSGLVP